MNTVDAARDSINMASARGMAMLPDLREDPYSFDHLCNMLGQMEAGMEVEKANRYLGWIQACIVCKGMGTLEEMKAINKRHL